MEADPNIINVALGFEHDAINAYQLGVLPSLCPIGAQRPEEGRDAARATPKRWFRASAWAIA